MAKQRYISTAIWDDDWFVEELDHKEKLFYFYLLTNEHTNIAGIYKLSVRKIALESGFSTDEVRAIFQTLEESRKVYYRDSHVIMTNWPKHQNWQSSERIHKGLRAILIKEIPCGLIDRIQSEGIPYAYPIDTLSKGINAMDMTHAYPSNYLDSDSDIDSDPDSDIPPIDDGVSIPPPKGSKSSKQVKFVKPTVEQVAQYCRDRKNDVHSQKFWDFYESKGWKVGKNAMKDWKACVRTWESNGLPQGRASPAKGTWRPEGYEFDSGGYDEL